MDSLENKPAFPHAATHASTVRLPRGRGTGRLTALRGIARAETESLGRYQIPLQNMNQYDILVKVGETPTCPTRCQRCTSRPDKFRATELRIQVVVYVIHRRVKGFNSAALYWISGTTHATASLEAFITITLEAICYWVIYV
jgi:hypothetical protein